MSTNKQHTLSPAVINTHPGRDSLINTHRAHRAAPGPGDPEEEEEDIYGIHTSSGTDTVSSETFKSKSRLKKFPVKVSRYNDWCVPFIYKKKTPSQSAFVTDPANCAIGVSGQSLRPSVAPNHSWSPTTQLHLH